MRLTDLQSKNSIIDLNLGKPGQPRIYTEEEIKQWRREQVPMERTKSSSILTTSCLNFVPREWLSGKALISPQNQRVIKGYMLKKKLRSKNETIIRINFTLLKKRPVLRG